MDGVFGTSLCGILSVRQVPILLWESGILLSYSWKELLVDTENLHIYIFNEQFLLKSELIFPWLLKGIDSHKKFPFSWWRESFLHLILVYLNGIKLLWNTEVHKKLPVGKVIHTFKGEVLTCFWYILVVESQGAIWVQHALIRSHIHVHQQRTHPSGSVWIVPCVSPDMLLTFATCVVL